MNNVDKSLALLIGFCELVVEALCLSTVHARTHVHRNGQSYDQFWSAERKLNAQLDEYWSAVDDRSLQVFVIRSKATNGPID
jgi:hypothetical protein